MRSKTAADVVIVASAGSSPPSVTVTFPSWSADVPRALALDLEPEGLIDPGDPTRVDARLEPLEERAHLHGTQPSA